MEPSEVIGDRYELGDAIGRGGMATIYRALDHRMGRTVAVKILREVYSTDPKFVTRFQREAQAASALQHPNIVQVFDFGQSQSNGNYYIVMEFIDGLDLRQYIKREGILSNERAIEIAHDVALGLGMAHRRGIVHRDVKPQNVLISHDGIVKLTDFGIASVYKDADAERLTTTGMTLGTVQYYAPEQAQGEIVHPQADVYALGIVMYEMLTGHTPFDGDSPVAVAMKHIQEMPEPPRHFNPNISPALERLILRCLEKDPRDRYRDGDALAYALEQTLRAPGGRRVGPSAPPPGPGAHGQFMPPLNLPTNDRAAPGLGARSGIHGGTAVASGPRGAPNAERYGPNRPSGAPFDAPGRGFGDEPTYDDMGDYPGALATRPNEAAPGTLPRMPWPGAQRPDQKGKRGNGTMAALIGGTLIFLLLACVLVAAIAGVPNAIGHIFNSPTVPPAPTAQMVSVPNFIGVQYAAAQKTAKDVGINVTEVLKQDTHKANEVIDQDQKAGGQIAVGATINLTVSSGPGKFKLPDYTIAPYTNFNDAYTKLSALGLICQIEAQQPSDSVPAGDVISTDPVPGTLVAKGDTIKIFPSSGPAAPTVTPSPSPSPSPTVTPSPTADPTATADPPAGP